MTEQQGGAARPPYPREPNVHSGGTQEPGSDRDLPPYDDRQKTGKGEDELASERGGPGTQAGSRSVSDAERGGVSDTDMAPSGPHGVGATTTTSGEDIGRGMSEAAQRSDRMDTGASREKNIDPDSPAVHTGDQGS